MIGWCWPWGCGPPGDAPANTTVTEPGQEPGHPYLSDNFAPVHDEVTIADLTGVMMGFVYDRAENRSDLVLLVLGCSRRLIRDADPSTGQVRPQTVAFVAATLTLIFLVTLAPLVLAIPEHGADWPNCRQSRGIRPTVPPGRGIRRTRALAREIHDTLAQGFTSIVALAQAVQAELNTGRTGHKSISRRTARHDRRRGRSGGG